MSSSIPSKLTSFFTSCSLSKFLAFGILCALAGSLVTFFIVGDGSYAPIDKSIRAALGRCFRAHSHFECEQHFGKALVDWIAADDHKYIRLNETKLAELVDWEIMKADVAEMKGAAESKNPVKLGGFLQEVLTHLIDAINKL